MQTRRHRISAEAKRLKDESNRLRLQLSSLRKNGPLIPAAVLKALAASGLPNDADAYNERLRELMAGA
jgi:transcriptional regulator of met regulon